MSFIINNVTHISRSVDTSTGEILNQKEYSVTYWDDEKGYLFWRSKTAVKSFDGFDLPGNLKDYEVAKLYRLSKRIYKNSNMIMYRSGNVMKAMQIDNIAKYLDMSDRQAKLFINNMIARRIIARAEVKLGDDVQVQYYMNPLFFFSGRWLSLNLYLLFKNDLDFLLPNWVVSRFNDSEIKR